MAKPRPPVLVGAVVGVDVRRSRSPQIHRAAFRALGIPGHYEAVSVAAAQLAPTIRRHFAQARRERSAATVPGATRYLNVTIPYKAMAARQASWRSPFVRASDAANTLIVRRGRLEAHNTDGPGLVAALRDRATFGTQARPLRGLRALVVGHGGAARAAMLALRGAGARVVVAARRGRGPSRRPHAIDLDDGVALGAALARTDLVVSAIPAVGWASRARRRALAHLGAHAAIMELAYGGRTPLGRAARARKLAYADGLPLLVHQAALAIELACGRKPPIEALRRAARRRR